MPEFNEQDISKFKDLLSKGIDKERAKSLIIKSKTAQQPTPQQQVQQFGQRSTAEPTALDYLGAIDKQPQQVPMMKKQPQQIPIIEKKPSIDPMSLRGFYEYGIKPSAQHLRETVGGVAEKTYESAKGGVERIGEAGVGLAEGKYTAPEAFMRGSAGAVETVTSPLSGVIGQGIEQTADIIPQDFKDYIGKKSKPVAEDAIKWYNSQTPEQQRQLQNIGVGVEMLANFIGAGAVGKQLTKKTGKEIIQETGEQIIKKPGIVGKTVGEIKKTPGKIEELLKKVEARISGPQEIRLVPGKGEIKVPKVTITAKKIAKQEAKKSKTALDILKPEKLTPKQLEKLKVEGKVKTGKGITGQDWEYIPDKKDLQIAKDSSDYLIKGKSTSENIKNLKKGIGELGEKTKQEIINKGDGIFNTKTIYSRLDKIDKPVLIRSDASLNNAYNNTIKKAKDLIEKSPKKRSELLKVRKEFDNFVNREFPNLYTSDTLTPMKTAIMDVRATLNDFIAEGLPKGNKFKELLKKQSNMYRAIDMLGPKSDITKIGRLIKTPAFRYGTSAAAGGAIGTTIF